MSKDESDLERRLDDGMEEIRAALDAADGDELPDEAAESVRESAEAVAEELSDASLGELLTVSGFEGESDDVTPADLPMLMQDADTDAVLSLRHLLEMADLSDEWSDLDAGERLDRIEQIGADEAEQESTRSVSDLLSSVFSLGSSDAEADGVEDEDEGETVDDDEEAENEFLSAEDAITEFGSLFGRLTGDDDDDGAVGDDDESDSEGESGGSGRGRATDMHSTMPSSRSDMGSRKRHSTVRKKH